MVSVLILLQFCDKCYLHISLTHTFQSEPVTQACDDDCPNSEDNSSPEENSSSSSSTDNAVFAGLFIGGVVAGLLLFAVPTVIIWYAKYL